MRALRHLIFAAALAFAAPAAAQQISLPYPACTAFGTTAGTCIQGAGALGTPSSGNATNMTSTTTAITDNSTKLATTAYTAGRPEFDGPLTSDMTSLTTGTWTKVTLGTPNIDTAAGWSTGNKNYVIPTTGKYRISGICGITVTTTGAQEQGCGISKNGTIGSTGVIQSLNELGGATAGTALHVSLALPPRIVSLTAADTIELDAIITGATTLTVRSDNQSTWLDIEWVGP
jgi:hypothetical protein